MGRYGFAIRVSSAAAADYLAMWEQAILPAVTGGDPAAAELEGAITGDVEFDARIVERAEARGYRRQPMPVGALVEVGRWQLQPAAAVAWESLRVAAVEDGRSLMIVSAHRSPELQRTLFVGRLAGRRSDAGIDAALATAAPPGYSKHHSGYAIDLAQPGQARGTFASTAAYEWLAADDFTNARAHGWIPSYPVDGVNMGPDPEPWEFVWVGVGGQDCVNSRMIHDGFCDLARSSHREAVVWLQTGGVVVGCGGGRFCVDSPITRGEVASMLWRLYGSPRPKASHGFSDVFDVHHFDLAVAWMVDIGLTMGTSPTTFSPNRPLSPIELSTLLARLAGVGAESTPSGTDLMPAQSNLEHQAPGEFVGRGEFASILRKRLVVGVSGGNVDYMITCFQKRAKDACHHNETRRMVRG